MDKKLQRIPELFNKIKPTIKESKELRELKDIVSEIESRKVNT